MTTDISELSDLQQWLEAQPLETSRSIRTIAWQGYDEDGKFLVRMAFGLSDGTKVFVLYDLAGFANLRDSMSEIHRTVYGRDPHTETSPGGAYGANLDTSGPITSLTIQGMVPVSKVLAALRAE